jgi:pyruvate formate-lyase/glycerol dehydratase family glycyl radical enzyme
MANPRIERLRESIRVETYPMCVEKGRLITESYRQTEGEPEITRRAKALAHVLDHITIFIEDGQLIVGNGASKPMGVEIDYYYSTWSEEEIRGLKQEGWDISDKDIADVTSMNAYWKNRNMVSRMGELFDEDRLWPFMQTGMLLPPWKTRGEGSGGGYAESGMGLGPGFYLCSIDFEKVLGQGLHPLRQEAEEELKKTRWFRSDSATKVLFLRAAIIALEAMGRFAARFARLAEALASKEADAGRRKELEKIAAICRRVPLYPAQSFHEAVQSVWFLFLIINPSTTASLGRMDQYLYPYYKKDVSEGRISDEEALELLQCLRIKDMQLNRVSGAINRQKNAGMAKWHNATIGGQTPDGRDATNELTYLILEAVKGCPTPHHTVTVRVHEGTPEPLMLKALEVVRTGIGMPAFVGDKSYIEFLLSEKVDLKVARDYCMAGCIDVSLAGQSRISSYPMFIVPLVLELTLNNGVHLRTGKRLGPETGDSDGFQSFEDLMKAFKQQLAHFMGLAAEYNNIWIRTNADLFPDAARTILMADAVSEGKSLLDRSFLFENGAVLNMVGMINVVDSLAAMKKLVFDEKKTTMKQLKASLQADWKGYEDLRRLCLAAPKYGNDHDEADSIARDLYAFWAETTVGLDTVLGGKHKPSAISISSQWPGGTLTGATPDGRAAGECLADGSMSPMRGRDTLGPTAVIKSASKIDQVPYQSTLLNMKFHPSALKKDEDLRKLGMLIQTYFSLGGKHVQFNVVNKETLAAAQQRPETHRDLVVRIAGYSAYFVQLGKPMQDEIISRTELQQF